MTIDPTPARTPAGSGTSAAGPGTTGPLTPGVDAPTWPAEFAERYRAAGHRRGETFGGVLRERAAAHPGQIALVDPAPERRTWTYRQLDERDRLAAGFAARGIGRGDRVVVQLPNIGEFIEVVFALFRIGALPVYALPAHRETEIAHFCSFAEAVAYVVPDVHDGFDHRALATRVQRHTPSLKHVCRWSTRPGAADRPPRNADFSSTSGDRAWPTTRKRSPCRRPSPPGPGTPCSRSGSTARSSVPAWPDPSATATSW